VPLPLEDIDEAAEDRLVDEMQRGQLLLPVDVLEPEPSADLEGSAAGEADAITLGEGQIEADGTTANGDHPDEHVAPSDAQPAEMLVSGATGDSGATANGAVEQKKESATPGAG
jgi:hypothetical protein